MALFFALECWTLDRVAVLMTCHNRKLQTMECLDALFRSELPRDYSLDVFLVDDDSSDGTEDAVRHDYPQVNVIKGDGSLFWNGGMRFAFSAAMDIGYDYYLWLNDDTILYGDALQQMLNTSLSALQKESNDVIVVGATHASNSEQITYGGLVAVSRTRPLTFKLQPVSGTPLTCDTMNGNCVLIPKGIAGKLGNLDASFAHSMGDIDYGLRAKKCGFQIIIAPGYVGACDRNSLKNTHYDAELGRIGRWKKITSSKELPVKSWYTLTKRHAGFLWPIYWAWPYMKVLLGRGVQ